MAEAQTTRLAGQLRAARIMVGFAWAADRHGSIMAFCICTIQAFVAALFAWWLKLLLDGLAAEDPVRAMTAAVAIALSVAAGAGLDYTGSRVRMELNERTHHLIEHRLIETVARTPTLEIHETPEHLTQLELLDAQSWEFGETIPSLIDLTNTAIRVVITVLLLASVHPLLLLLPVFGIPTLLASPYTSQLHSRGAERSAESGRRSNDLWELATTAGPAKEIRLFRLNREILGRFHDASQEVRQTFFDLQLRGRLVGLGAQLVFMLGYFGAIVFVVDQAVRGRATVGEVLLTAVLAGQVLSLLGHSAEVVQGTSRSLTVAGRLVYLHDIAARARRRTTDATAPTPTRLTTGITLDNVTYRYPDGRTDALHAVNLHLPAGATVALVGANGSGKTTLVKLLAGLSPPTAGQISIDSTDLNSLGPDQWRLRVSAAFQDHARWELLVREAVGIGDLVSLDDPEAIITAIDRAGAADLPQTLPTGLNTQLGPSWPAGIDLSGGQWQKLAIARAMMRSSPLLLLLDEPTAALDAATEHRLFERWTAAAADLRHRTGGVTVLVSHRFSTVRMADLIVVLDKGHIIDTGTHNELLIRKGIYAELFELQARSYR